MAKNKLQPKYPCRAKEPAKCPYHGAFIRLNTATTYVDYEAAKKEVLEVQKRSEKMKLEEYPLLTEPAPIVEGLIKPPIYVKYNPDGWGGHDYSEVFQKVNNFTIPEELEKQRPEVTKVLNRLKAEIVNARDSSYKKFFLSIEFSAAVARIRELPDYEKDTLVQVFEEEKEKNLLAYAREKENYSVLGGWSNQWSNSLAFQAAAKHNGVVKILHALGKN